MNTACLLQTIIVFSLLQTTNAQQPANNKLSNLDAATSVNASLVPAANNTLNLGNGVTRWKSVNLYNLVFANGSVQTTAFTPYTAGTGISIRENKITNTAPDKIITLSAGAGISIAGTYPNFNISSAVSSQWISNGNSVYCNTGNIGIGVENALAKLQVAGGDALINGVTIGMGGAGISSNLVVGAQALASNTSGFSNTVYGSNALFSNTSGYDNCAIGENALYANIDGIQNTSIGNGTLYYNVNGVGNTAVGNGALLNNGAVRNDLSKPDGSYNTANGFFALFNNSTGSYNAALGAGALNANADGSYNTAVGSFSDMADSSLQNATAIGANSIASSSNMIRLGDVNVTVVESAAGSWTTSDGRFKKNVRENVAGLSFINLLRPVLYNFDAAKFDAFLSQRFPDSVKAKRKAVQQKLQSKSSSIVQTGFIAQEVAAAAKKAGFDFNGVHVPESNDDHYSLSYEKLVVPLVKAVQELSQQNNALQQQLNALQEKIILLENYKQPVQSGSVMLGQNVPNPAAGNTSISYTVPLNARSAELLISDKQGRIVQRVSLAEKNKGAVSINLSSLTAGTYQYTLYVDGNIAAARQMTILQ